MGLDCAKKNYKKFSWVIDFCAQLWIVRNVSNSSGRCVLSSGRMDAETLSTDSRTLGRRMT